jgi:hypothetical protein
MTSQSDNPFSTIESAHEFVKLLTKAVSDAKRELEAQVERESGSDAHRRLDALRIALYSLGKLEAHTRQSSRILNDLRTLRRLMLAERGTETNTRLPSLERRTEGASAENLETDITLDRLPI